MNNNINRNNNRNNDDPFLVIGYILAIIGLIGLIYIISSAYDEVKKDEARQAAWRYEHIEKKANVYRRNHPNNTYSGSQGTTTNTSGTTTSSNSSASTSTNASLPSR